MREQLPFTIGALGHSVNQPSAELQDPRSTDDVLVPGATQEIGLHLSRNRTIARTKLGNDGEPHRDICGRHKDLPAHNTARPF
jgi:hypothetical protein